MIAAAPHSIFFAFLNFFPFAFKNLGYSASEFGYFMILLPTTFIVGNLISRKLTPMLGITKMVRMGSLIIVAGMSVMAGLVFLGFESAWGLVIPGMVYSLGAGLSQSNATMGAINAVGPAVRGLGSGLGGRLQMLLGSGIAASTILLGAAEDTRIGVGILLLVAIVSFVATLFLVKDSSFLSLLSMRVPFIYSYELFSISVKNVCISSWKSFSKVSGWLEFIFALFSHIHPNN